MKVIDLLNKIADDELEDEIEFRIGSEEVICKYGRVGRHIYFEDVYGNSRITSISPEDLNVSVEIIEEDKKIEKLEHFKITDETLSGLRTTLNVLHEDYESKINELIDEVNKLKEEK